MTSTSRDKLSGQSYRITYNKLISDTQSNIALAAYRFSTRDYLDLLRPWSTRTFRKGSDLCRVTVPDQNRYSLTLSQVGGRLGDILCRRAFAEITENRNGKRHAIPVWLLKPLETIELYPDRYCVTVPRGKHGNQLAGFLPVSRWEELPCHV